MLEHDSTAIAASKGGGFCRKINDPKVDQLPLQRVVYFFCGMRSDREMDDSGKILKNHPDYAVNKSRYVLNGY
ncbi:hypothetical protein J41TS12_00840 [Paenibacillus antibioticophila]|uniref:Uncharacterized protein n=1 Tax=Paenibacillus antibioticophila TaxID=1274374 RepID=A0A919XRY9_9BACL|nr:hypothetical protein [Paenibacillus antibioticophila]GIO35223.1 hypothetical protein J41TS12_00840 [Paenibacillus antibioticophila]